LIVFSQSSAVAPFIYTCSRLADSVLGISAYYHDSAACLVVDGRIVAAAQEERFTRKKHDADFPSKAVEYCLKEGGITAAQLTHVGFYEKPLVKFERLLETYTSLAPRGWRSYLMAMPTWLGEKLWMSDDIADHLEGYEGPIFFGEHHESHAASAFYPSPFEQAAVVTIDGVGEWATSSIGVGRGNDLESSASCVSRTRSACCIPPSPTFAGFKVNSGEYKVMGLAPYGEPKYVDLIKKHLVEIRDDWQLVDEPGVLHLRARPDHDRFEARGAARRPGAQARVAADAARDGSRAIDPGDHRRGDAEDDRVRAQGERPARSVPGRRRGAELRRQRPHPARRSVRADLDSAGRG
jgi:predicted NodU family carbamoyl transferase